MIIKKTLILTYLTVFSLSGYTEYQYAQNNTVNQNKPCMTITKSKAIAIATQRKKGKVLSAKLYLKSKPPIYKVKVVNHKGHVKVLRIPACSFHYKTK